MTVSRALSGNENVSAKTRQSVMEHATLIGYVKNSAATTMRGEQTAIVGLLLPNIINEFYARIANSLGLLCTDAGFDLVIHLTNDDYDQEVKSLLRLEALQARAVIRVPTPSPSTDQLNHTLGPRLINLIRTRDEENCAGSLLLDDGISINAAVNHLVKKGYQRIGYIGAAENLSSGRQRLAAFTEALRKNGHERDEHLICTGAPSYNMGRDFMLALLDTPTPPDALVCGGFEISNGALEACLTRNINMPGKLAFVGYGDPSFYRWIAGGITTITVSEHDVASRAIEMVQDADSLKTNSQQIIPTKLVIRSST